MLDPSDILAGKVLVVDDEESCVRLLERMLSGAGYSNVESTTDPYLVSELHRRNRYDLILLDLLMPGMDGFEVLESLKEVENDPFLSVLVATAHVAHKERAIQAGAKDFVSKPFDSVEVLTHVYHLLELRFLHLRNRLQDTPPRTVLYVEDNAANLKLVEQLIERRPDLRLMSAQDGSLGIALARASLPAVILMDIALPGISGIQALKILRDDPATTHIPVVALTAGATPGNGGTGLEAGFFRYLSKPFKIDDFMETLEAALASAVTTPEQTSGAGDDSHD